MNAAALRTLLEGLVDYAGLFPPAALSMERALEHFQRHRSSADAWILGRFVVPQERLGEVPAGVPLSILGMPTRRDDDAQFEVKAASETEIERIAEQRGDATVYVEIADLALLDAIARHRLRAKIRTGGVTIDAFPAIERVALFIRACRDKGVSFKATAGLHHPLRCVRPLTYETDAPIGTMHGFLNVFLAAAFPGDEEAVLAETNAGAFTPDDDGIAWRGRRVSVEQLRDVRAFATSFGSCSFDEPVTELREIGWV